MGISELCELLPWDTDFFGKRIARVSFHRLDPVSVKEVLNWCRDQRVECLYFLSDIDHPETFRLALDHGFQPVDLRVTLDREQAEPSAEFRDPRVTVRPHREADLSALRAIARDSHHDTRFFQDPGFGIARAEALYETWIDRSCSGWADLVLVAEVGGRPAGYITGTLDEKGAAGQIGLFAVSAADRGRSVGTELLREGLAWFSSKKAGRVSVVTQGRNIPAQRLYQAGGFKTRSIRLWYHLWFQI